MMRYDVNYYNEYKIKLLNKASEKKIPIAGEFEITANCNMNCKMCYVHKHNKTKDLSNDDWYNIITQAINSGMLFANFTGGEIFLKNDFMDLYERVYDLGIKIILYTNGTLLSDEVIERLKSRPPEYIAITIYGDSAEMYEKICGYKDGFSRVINNIEKMRLANLNIVLRTIPILETYNNLDNLLELLLKFNLPIENSLYVGPNRYSNKKSDVDRLSPTQLLQYQKMFEEKLKIYFNKPFVNTSNGFNCSAGKSAFFVNWEGKMSICSLFDYPRIDILNSDFKTAWDKLKQSVSQSKKCSDCEKCKFNNLCYVCPAKLYSEGNIEKCSSYLLECAKVRFADKNGKI